jgi:hypothetical protein
MQCLRITNVSEIKHLISWNISKSVISKEELSNSDLSCPFLHVDGKPFKDVICLMTVKENSTWRLPSNDVASVMVDQNVWGDCVIAFKTHEDEHLSKLKFNVMCEIVKRTLLKEGMQEKSILY